MKLFIFLILNIILISCALERNCDVIKKEVGNNSFSIPIKIYKETKYPYTMNYYSKVTRPSWSSPLIYKFTCDSTDLVFHNTDYEIAFPRYYYDSFINHFKPVFYLIGYKIEPEMKGFVIIFLNNVQNVEKFNKYSSQKIEISNQIDEKTDSVFTSLSNREFRALFPKFKGNYQQIKIDSIIINHLYLPDDYEFYNSIKLYDFEIGKRWK